MANYLQDIQPLEGDGVTDADILATLQASGVTHSPINRANLVHVLNLRGMLQKIVGNNSDEKWIGTVLAMQDMIIAGGNAEQIAGIRLWLSHITNPTNQLWDTTQAEFAAPFWALYQAFKDEANTPSAEDFQALAAMGGGWVYGDLTTAKIAELRAEHEALIATTAYQWQQHLNARALAENQYTTKGAVYLDANPEATLAEVIAAAEAE